MPGRLTAARWVMALVPRLDKDHNTAALARWLVGGRQVPPAARKAMLAMALNPTLAWFIDTGTQADSDSWLNLLRWWNTFAPHLCTHEWLRGFGQAHLRSYGHMHPRVAAWFKARLGE